MLLSCPILNSTLLKNRFPKNFASAVSYFCCVLNFFPLGCFTCITDLKNLLPDCFHTSAEAKRHLLCVQDVSVGRHNSMQKEIFAPAAIYLFHLNTYILNVPTSFFFNVYTLVRGIVLLHKSTTSLSFPPTLRCWSLYLVKKSILPESEHHHVRPVSSPEGSKKVLNGKRWREKSVQKRPNKGMKRHSCLDHFPETAHRETEQGTQHCCSAPGHRLKSMETSWRG